MTLEELAFEHDYSWGISTENYYKYGVTQTYETMSDFLHEYRDARIDLNLIYRWDVKKHEENDSYYAHVFIIQQRLGSYVPCIILSFVEEEVEPFVELLEQHKAKLMKIWEPIA